MRAKEICTYTRVIFWDKQGNVEPLFLEWQRKSNFLLC